MKSRRSNAWALGLVSAAVFVTSVARMADRLRDYNQTLHHQLWAFQELDERECTFAGKSVMLADATDPDGQKLVVKYGEDQLRLRVTIPGDKRLPGLVPHRDWMRLVRFAEQTNITQAQLAKDLSAGTTRDHLAIVCRVPRPGADPETWGRVWRTDTVFEFYEFKPEGGFAHERLVWPRTKQDQPSAEGELQEDSWQMQAALRLIPAGMGPKAKYRYAAMHATGWTWPLAFIGVVGMMAALFIGAKPRRERVTYQS